MITNIEQIETQNNLTLYRVTSPIQETKRPPSLTIKFNSEQDLFDYFMKHVALINEDEKKKIIVDLNNIQNEDEFGKKVLDEYAKAKSSE